MMVLAPWGFPCFFFEIRQETNGNFQEFDGGFTASFHFGQQLPGTTECSGGAERSDDES